MSSPTLVVDAEESPCTFEGRFCARVVQALRDAGPQPCVAANRNVVVRLRAASGVSRASQKRSVWWDAFQKPGFGAEPPPKPSCFAVSQNCVSYRHL